MALLFLDRARALRARKGQGRADETVPSLDPFNVEAEVLAAPRERAAEEHLARKASEAGGGSGEG